MRQLAHVCALRYNLSYLLSALAIRPDLSEQQLLTHQRNKATGMFFLHYDMICPAADNSF